MARSKTAERLRDQLGDPVTLADEPLLEKSLDARAADARELAAGLLACLPGSRLLERAATAVGRYVSVVGDPPRLRVTSAGQPGELAALADQAARDQYEIRCDSHAERILAAVALVPPDRLAEILGHPAGELARMPLVIDGAENRDAQYFWHRVLRRHPDPDLARAVLARSSLVDGTILAALPPQEAETAITRDVQRMDGEAFAMAASQLPAELTRRPSEVILRRVAQYFDHAPSMWFTSARTIPRELASRLHPTTALRAAELFEAHTGGEWDSTTDAILEGAARKLRGRAC